ncbi:hypothetical protein BH11PSE11_BH11PSE11_26380 [soil metagenome]
MDDGLTADEYDALSQIGKGRTNVRTNACIARNSKRLNGLKYISHAKDGSLSITEKGSQTLFLKNCIDGLRAISTDPLAPLAREVVTFLGKKGHIVARESGAGFDISQRGRESLADIDANSR